MDGADGNRSLTDGAGDSLDGTVADITGGEDTRQAGFEWERGAVGRPGVGRHVGSGEDEPVVVQADGVAQPVGVGFGADEDEDGGRGDLFAASRLGVLEHLRSGVGLAPSPLKAY